MKSLELKPHNDDFPVRIVASFENTRARLVMVMESEKQAHMLGMELRKADPPTGKAALEIVRAWRKGQPVQYEVIE